MPLHLDAVQSFLFTLELAILLYSLHRYFASIINKFKEMDRFLCSSVFPSEADHLSNFEVSNGMFSISLPCL